MTRIKVGNLVFSTEQHDDSGNVCSIHSAPVKEQVNKRPLKALDVCSLPQIIRCLEQDLSDIDSFYSISISSSRFSHLRIVLDETSSKLKSISFSDLDQDAKVDYLLTKNFIRRHLLQLDFESEKVRSMQPLLHGWAAPIQEFFELRQQVSDIDWSQTAGQLSEASYAAQGIVNSIVQKKFDWNGSPSLADRVTRVIDELNDHLEEALMFYRGYHPLATWWLEQPCVSLVDAIHKLKSVIKINLVGIEPGDKDAIIGDPIGRAALLADIEAEFLAYTPEQLIEIGEHEYVWCEAQMKKASAELGYGQEWRSALEHVKNMYPPPGEQPLVVQKLAKEAANYVREADLVTVPQICEDTRRTIMMSPERQKANPFFLGGRKLIISYPTKGMDHESKMMSMRGNSIPNSKATVFHELIPGHHLQSYYLTRHNTHRKNLFNTPFWEEGWALYWEFMFWERGDFFTTPEERIGTLFWRMHRCARIVFSIKFHLGQMTPQECVDYLVEKVGHERATAEGEVRRSFNGDYSPLYQAGYMLGALQLRYLRHELVDSKQVGEKEFHDRILRTNRMPIDMLRALLTDAKLSDNYEPGWKFYDKHWHTWG